MNQWGGTKQIRNPNKHNLFLCRDASFTSIVNINSIKNVVGDESIDIIPLRISSVGPPMPRVEDQHVHAYPSITSLYGV